MLVNISFTRFVDLEWDDLEWIDQEFFIFAPPTSQRQHIGFYAAKRRAEIPVLRSSR
jgi:hypothetical protein